MSILSRSACLILVLFPAIAAAQEGQPQEQPGPPPGPRIDATFFRAQALRALNEKVDLLIEQGKADAAIEELRRVDSFEIAKESPAFEMKVRLLGKLAGLYASTGRKTEALATVKRALAEAPPGSPAEAAAWLDAGTAYRALGMADEALKAFDRAIELSNALAQKGWRPPQAPAGPRPGRLRDAPRPGGGGPGEATQPPADQP